MKKTISIILAILSLVTLLAGCGGGSAEPTETREPAAQTNVAKPLTFEEFNSLPIANANMTEDELRNLIVTFMRYQNSFAWTPNQKLSYNSNDKFILMAPGLVYGGLPYISLCQGNIYNMFNYYDDRNGMIDTAAISQMKQDWHKVLANQCSGSPYWAWSRVSNSLRYVYTSSMVVSNGCIPVGPYYVDPKIQNFKLETIDTRELCAQNGEQIMFQSYAAMKPGDGIVYLYKNDEGGHVIMCSSVPKVVYNDDGKINAMKSTITFLDQALVTKLYPQENGVNKNTFGNVDETYTFEKLYKLGCLPWTLPELVGKDDIEKGEATVANKPESVTVDDLSKMDVNTNYGISYNQVVIKDKKGKELYKNWTYSCGMNVFSLKAVSSEALNLDDLKALAGNGNTVEISTRISTGEVITVYSGKLVS